MMIKQSTREVEDNGAKSACRGIANIACTRCAEAINTRYREEMLLLLEVVVVVVGEGDSCAKKEESAAAEIAQKRNCAVNGHGA
jgi:hypothetical protein